ncbi:MAG: hypothetical protein V1859_00660 [archaeon]
MNIFDKYKRIFTVRNFLIISIITFLFFVFDKDRRLVFIIAMVSLNVCLAYIKHIALKNLNLPSFGFLTHISNAIELITFGTVIGSYIYGPLTGMTVGSLSMIGSYVAEKKVSKFSLATIPLYIIIGFAASIIKISDIRLLGIIISLIFNILLILIIIVAYRIKTGRVVIFSAVNLLFNYYVFYNFSELILKII